MRYILIYSVRITRCSRAVKTHTRAERVYTINIIYAVSTYIPTYTPLVYTYYLYCVYATFRAQVQSGRLTEFPIRISLPGGLDNDVYTYIHDIIVVYILRFVLF